MKTGTPSLFPEVDVEEIIYSSRYSNNGSSPMWCFNSTCVVRQGDDVFVSGYERVPGAPPMNDCRWALWQRTTDGWQRAQADERGRTREPSPLACLSPERVLVSANPTLLPPEVSGGGLARPEALIVDAVHPQAAPRVVLPEWQGSPDFTEHSYRTLAADRATGAAIFFQNSGYSHAEWALLDGEGTWRAGQLSWPSYAATDLAPFGASHARVNYPVVVLRDRAVHFCGVAAYDNWSRVCSVADLGLDDDPNRSGASGMAGRQRGNRFRKLLYAWTGKVGEKPFSDWVEVDNAFDDGGWLFATDLHVDAAGTVHLLWFRSPMLPALRDALYPDIKRVYRVEYATLRDGKILSRRTLLQAGEGADPAIPTDLDQVGRPYVLLNGERILGDAIATPRFQMTPDGRLFVVYYVTDGKSLSENRILEIYPDGTASALVKIPLRYPLTQFFTATPRAGCSPSYTLDLLGYRQGGWRHAEGTGGREWDGTISYARVRLAPSEKEGLNVILIGDSTVADYPIGGILRGWGQMLPRFFDAAVSVLNLAANGRSTKTFIQEKRWEEALKHCQAGACVLIQFGHNDSHEKDKPESTDASTDFKDYLRQYVDDVLKKRAVPVLVTPMHRRRFDSQGHVTQELAPYAEAMKSVAVEKKVPCVDLHRLSGDAIQGLGEAGCAELFCSPDDRTHFSEKGALFMARLIAAELQNKKVDLVSSRVILPR